MKKGLPAVIQTANSPPPNFRGDLDQSRSNVEDLEQTGYSRNHQSKTSECFPRHLSHPLHVIEEAEAFLPPFNRII